jgi:transposase-like protein
MTKRIERDPIYRCRRFSSETIELCVRWYITYRLSYRDLAAMMAERDFGRRESIPMCGATPAVAR